MQTCIFTHLVPLSTNENKPGFFSWKHCFFVQPFARNPVSHQGASCEFGSSLHSMLNISKKSLKQLLWDSLIFFLWFFTKILFFSLLPTAHCPLPKNDYFYSILSTEEPWILKLLSSKNLIKRNIVLELLVIFLHSASNLNLDREFILLLCNLWKLKLQHN